MIACGWVMEIYLLLFCIFLAGGFGFPFLFAEEGGLFCYALLPFGGYFGVALGAFEGGVA